MIQDPKIDLSVSAEAMVDDVRHPVIHKQADGTL